MRNQQSLRLHQHFHFFQMIGNQGTTWTYNIKNGIRQSNIWSNLYRACNYMNIRSYIVFSQKIFQYFGIRGCNNLSIKPLNSRIFYFFWYGQRKSTLTETQSFSDYSILFLFGIFIFAYYSDICNPISHGLWYIIIA